MHIGREEQAGEESAGQMLVTGQWPHFTMPPTCSYARGPSPPVLVWPTRVEALGTHSPSPSRGAGWRDRPWLRSHFRGRKGEGRGASDKSAAVAVFYPFCLLTVTQVRVINATEVELLHTQAEPGLILLLFCSETIQGSFCRSHNSDKGCSRETKNWVGVI